MSGQLATILHTPTSVPIAVTQSLITPTKGHTMRERISIEDVAADPTNCFQVTVHGDVAVKALTIHEDGTPQAWTYIQYENGSSSAGTPKHWHSFVRITDDEKGN